MDVLPVKRHESVRFTPDPRRVITKAFIPGEVFYADGSSRIQAVLQRIAGMAEHDVTETLAAARTQFAGRHRDLDGTLRANFENIASRFEQLDLMHTAGTPERRQLLGAYFTHEYSIEAAALGNPSIVAAPDQSGLEPGQVRFVMSLRAIGEGHISSIEFRSGVVDVGSGADVAITLDPASTWATTGDKTQDTLDRSFFAAKLAEMGSRNQVVDQVLAQLGEEFTIIELEAAIGRLDDEVERTISGETTRLAHWVASSNYRVTFPIEMDVSERVLFPTGPTESHGMEDARFVRFVDDDGKVTYYATYTAFDGHQILTQMLATDDFASFQVSTMSGIAAHNKGIALFPRRIDGQYVALGRHDNVNNYVMTSDDIRVWNDVKLIQQPERPWELMQLGNCGSPLETGAGWLVITHGVGPFRRYTLGALLLDIDDPSHVIGHLAEPLLSPESSEREGYVPNVVYSCGSMIHGDHLVLPYGFADVGAGIATVALDDLLTQLTG